MQRKRIPAHRTPQGVRLFLVPLLFFTSACQSATSVSENADLNADHPHEAVWYSYDEFAMGVDLSYVNQILDHGGVYRDGGEVRDPYEIVADYGANLVRLRKWHNPVWVRNVYDDPGKTLYSGLEDVGEAIGRSRELGMAVLLDFHYSDFWADPGRQEIPEAWMEIGDLSVLVDSVYNYTHATLSWLDERGLMPEMVQVGNETNCGMLYSNAPVTFPPLNGCQGHWSNLAAVFNSGIQAVRDVSAGSDVETKVLLHVAQPENVTNFFDNVTGAGVTDFDVVGFSYYANWSNVSLSQIGNHVANFRQRYGGREVMILETAYSWTMQNADNYGNIFGQNSLLPSYPATPQGQLDYLTDLTQQVLDGGGTGVIYWEPAWITSDLRDSWGQGSAWDNNTFFDHDGEVLPAMEFMTWPYEF